MGHRKRRVAWSGLISFLGLLGCACGGDLRNNCCENFWKNVEEYNRQAVLLNKMFANLEKNALC